MPNSITESISFPLGCCHPFDDEFAGAPAGGGGGVASTAELRSAGDAPRARSAVIELTVRNHAGAMSHITGMFARRAFNLEAIACAPAADGATSRMLLLVGTDARLEQVERQLTKLYDVLHVRHRDDIEPEYFARIAAI